MNKEELKNLWQDKKSWKFWGIYLQKKDPRIIVPTRLKWTGWTVNFGHPIRAFIAILISIIIALGPTLLLVFFGPLDVFSLIVTMVVTIFILIALAAWLAKPPLA